MNVGGNVSALVYKKYLTEEGLPKTIGESILPLFTKAFHARNLPVWNDIEISTVDDGLHSYGQGIWIFHDHREKGITTDGMNVGGNVSALVYKKYLTEEGLPKTIGESILPLFTKAFHARKLPVWQDIDAWNSLGEVDGRGFKAPPPAVPLLVKGPKSMAEALKEQASAKGSNSFRNFIAGLLLGILAYTIIINREKILALIPSKKGGA
jgi:hypothetical protein